MNTRQKRQYFTNLFYLFMGLLLGIVGNVWVYYYSKWVEFNLPNQDWNLSLLIFSAIFIVWAFFLLRYIRRGMKE
jgi:H+/Cl- antiporter ClcA